jgi:hypothetical protein
MVKALSHQLRWNIITVWQRCRGINKTARELGLRSKVVSRWVQRFRATGGVEEARRTGRRKALDGVAASKAVDLLLSGDHNGCGAVARELKAQGLTATQPHATTVLRAAVGQAKAEGRPIRAMRGAPGKRLADSTKAKRLAFARANLGRDWRNVIFTDRKRFLFLYPGTKVRPVEWVLEGEAPEATRAAHPLSFNIYVGITPQGATAVHAVAGTSKHTTSHVTKQGAKARNITADEYPHVLRRTLLPGGARMLGAHGMAHWVLQQDNDPSHRGAPAVVEAHNKAFGTHVSVLAGWPPSSPDLNLIENFWATVQRRVHARGCKTFEQFCAAVEEEVAGVSKRELGALYASMGKRLREVIKRGGDKSGY